MSDLFHSSPINEFPIDRYRQRRGRREQLYRVIRYDRVRLVWVVFEEWRPASQQFEAVLNSTDEGRTA